MQSSVLCAEIGNKIGILQILELVWLRKGINTTGRRRHILNVKESSPIRSIVPNIQDLHDPSTFTMPLLNYAFALLLTTSLTAASPTTPQARNATLIPYGKKAGSAGGRAVPHWKDHLGWWYDWTPKPSGHDEVPGVSMLWGSGNNGKQDSQRFHQFQQLKETPKFLLGFNEPDCSAPDVSAHISVPDATKLWNQYIAPKGRQGSLLGSPSMCTQKDESWLKQFNGQHLDKSWDFTTIHVYKPDMKGVKEDIEHYWNTYGKPIWVTEFGCVYDQQGFKPCSDQGQINKWIRDVVDLFEGDDRIAAYAYTDGGGLGNKWLPTNQDGSALSESGRTYLDAIKKYN